MADNFAELEFEAAFEKDENQRKRTKALRGAAKNIGIHPMQYGADDHTRGHKDDDVRHARESHQSIGDERQNKQAAEQREEEIQVHRNIRLARSGKIVAEIRNRSK